MFVYITHTYKTVLNYFLPFFSLNIFPLLSLLLSRTVFLKKDFVRISIPEPRNPYLIGLDPVPYPYYFIRFLKNL
jgi:hypothetical protein